MRRAKFFLERIKLDACVSVFAFIEDVSDYERVDDVEKMTRDIELVGNLDAEQKERLMDIANITTTQVYTHVTDKHLREIHKKFHNKVEK